MRDRAIYQPLTRQELLKGKLIMQYGKDWVQELWALNPADDYISSRRAIEIMRDSESKAKIVTIRTATENKGFIPTHPCRVDCNDICIRQTAVKSGKSPDVQCLKFPIFNKQ